MIDSGFDVMEMCIYSGRDDVSIISENIGNVFELLVRMKGCKVLNLNENVTM